MIITTCPNCNQEFPFNGNPEIGQHAICQLCGVQLEVVWLYPLSLDYLEDVASPMFEDATNLENS